MPLAANPGQDVAHWRTLIQDGRAAIAARFFQRQHAISNLQQHTQLVDGVLQEIWLSSNMPESAVLIAVGGYGHGLLFPHSDVDLLLLLESEASSEVATKLEQMIGLFWDIGLDVGHSVRTVSECLEESAKDVTVQTNLLEARRLAGSASVFESLLSSLHLALDRPAFLQAKQLEQQQRHARFHDTAYNLEPNLKESPGGLRDLQTVLWISQALKLGSAWKELAAEGLITPQEARQIQRNQQYLQGLRIRLHYLARRREDRLLFDYQTPLAEQLGFKNQKNRSASELLMQRYYRTAKAVSLMNEILLQNLGTRLRSAPEAPPSPSATVSRLGINCWKLAKKLFSRTNRAPFWSVSIYCSATVN